jgi:DNA-binding response OmpR family regulator
MGGESLKKKQIAVFDLFASECGYIASAVREWYGEDGAEVTEYTNTPDLSGDFMERVERKDPFHMVFMGIEGMTGVETARDIRKIDELCPMFIVSSSGEYAVEGYRLHVTDYLKKPVTAERIGKAVARIGRGLSRQERDMARANPDPSPDPSPAPNPDLSPDPSPAPHTPYTLAKARNRRTIAAIASVACLSVALIAGTVLLGRDGGPISIEDEQVPLAAPDLPRSPDVENSDIENPLIENSNVENPLIENPNVENSDIEYPDIEYPLIGDMEIPADASEASIDWRNPESNTHWLTLEIVLTETGETLYKSEKVAPGGCIEIIPLARGLPPGEHRTQLITRAYVNKHADEADSQTETDERREEITLVATQ